MIAGPLVKKYPGMTEEKLLAFLARCGITPITVDGKPVIALDDVEKALARWEKMPAEEKRSLSRFVSENFFQ